MDEIEEIKRLFKSVFETERANFRVEPGDIQRAIYEMAHAYKPDPNWENYLECHTTGYDVAGHRCAYLHKYAMIHTGLVYDIMQQALYINCIRNIFDTKKDLKLCSLGSGPGTDILALLFLLVDYMPNKCTAYLVDKSIGWSSVFNSIIQELRSKNYSNKIIASTGHFDYEYLRADLLDSIPRKVYGCIKNADIITMVKFISAAACNKTRNKIKDIFRAMKPGAIFLFIDNAAGGFYEMVEETADVSGMDLVFGPLKHLEYEEKRFKTEQERSTSQFKTRVTAAIWKKLEVFLPSSEMDGMPPTRRLLSIFSETENMEDVFGGEVVQFQCASKPAINKDFRTKSFDEVDHTSSQNIRLHSDTRSQEISKSDSCCLVM